MKNLKKDWKILMVGFLNNGILKKIWKLFSKPGFVKRIWKEFKKKNKFYSQNGNLSLYLKRGFRKKIIYNCTT